MTTVASEPAAADRRATGRMCFVQPAASGQPLSNALASTIRSQAGHLEVLHKVQCSDGSVHFVWIGDDDL